MHVYGKRSGNAAAQRSLHYEVESVDVGKLVADYVALYHSFEVLFNSFRSDLLLKHFIVGRIICDQ